MNLGEILVLLGAVTAVVAVVFRAVSLRDARLRLRLVADSMTCVSFATVTAAFVFLACLFLSSDFDYLYVWSNSSSDLGFVYKISGVWAGGAGSVLVWTWFMTLVTVVELLIDRRHPGIDRRFTDVFQLSSMAIVSIFTFVLISMGPFEETVTSTDTAWRLLTYPEGMGLRFSFQTPEMILHPIFVFAGYSLCLCVFSASLSHFVTKDAGWTAVSRRWSRPAWFFITLGIGIGAIWAYYVIGWGGYWSWDPVETSSLIIWLLVTVFLHTQTRYSGGREYKVLSPAIGMLSFVSVIFTTFVTRAGGIWVGSVHTFNVPSGQGAGERLIDVLQRNPQISGLLFLIIILLILTSYLSISRYRTYPNKAEGEDARGRIGTINDRKAMLIAVGILIITILVMLLLLFKNTDVSQSSNYEEFNQKMSIFAVAIMISMTTCLIWRRVGARIAIASAVLVAFVSVVLAIVGGVFGFSPFAAFALPSSLAAASAALVKIAKSATEGPLSKRVRNAAPHLVHLGVAFILIGYVFSSTLQVSPQKGGNVLLHPRDDLNVGDYTIQLVSLEMKSVTPPASQAYDAKGSATFDLSKSGRLVGGNVTISNLYLTFGTDFSRVSAGAHIEKTAFEDLYLNFDWEDNDTAVVHAKVVPLINVLWGGLILLCTGIMLLVIQKNRGQANPRVQPDN